MNRMDLNLFCNFFALHIQGNMDNLEHLVIDTDGQNVKRISREDTLCKQAEFNGNKIDVNNRSDGVDGLVEKTTAFSVNADNGNGNCIKTATLTTSEEKTRVDMNNSIGTMPNSSAEKEINDDHKCETNNEDENKTCTVCGGTANGVYFGALVCLPCKSFYIRSTKDGEPHFTCSCKTGSDKTKQGRTKCQYCRYQQCLTAGMCRKEKPELVQITDGQKLCKVCGDIANGIHFGIETCEGCKKFFRRGIVENKSYTCKGQKNCSINPRNRNNCRYCRYVKCINEGMSRDAIKMGRPKKQSENSENIKNVEEEMSSFDSKITPSRERTFDLQTPSDLPKASASDTAILKSLLIKSDDKQKVPQSYPLIAQVGDSAFGNVQPDPFNLNTPMKTSYENSLPEYKIPSGTNNDPNINEDGRGISTAPISTENMYSYCDDLDDILQSLESNQKSLDQEQCQKLYDVGVNKHTFIRPNMSSHNSNKEHILDWSSQHPIQYTTRSGCYTDSSASSGDADSVPDHINTTVTDAPKIIFDYQHKHYDFEVNGLLNIFGQQTMVAPVSNFKNEKSTYAHQHRTTEKSWQVYHRDLLDGYPSALKDSYRSSNATWNRINNQDTRNTEHNMNDKLFYGQADGLNRQNMYYTDRYTFDKDRTSSTVSSEHFNPAFQSQRPYSPDVTTGLSYDNYTFDKDRTSSTVCSEHSNPAFQSQRSYSPDVTTCCDNFPKNPVHSVSHTAGSKHNNGQVSNMSNLDTQESNSTNSFNGTPIGSDSKNDCVPIYSHNDNELRSLSGLYSPYFDQLSQMRINELFGSLEDCDSDKYESVFLSDLSNSEDKPTMSTLYDCIVKSSAQDERSLADKEECVSVSSKRKREKVECYQNQDAFLGYLKYRNNYDKNLICGQFNLELSVRYWHKPVQLGTGTRIYEPVLQKLLEEYDKLKSMMDESKQHIEEDCNYVPWPRDLERSGKHWNHVTRRILRNTKAAISFFSNVPGFNDMNLDDRKNILNTATFAGANIIAAVHYFDIQNHRYKNFWNWHVDTENPMYPFRLKLLEFGEVLHSLNMTDMEAAVVVSLLLLSADWSDLNDPVTMEREREKLIEALQTHLMDEGKDPVDRIQKLFYYMPKARLISVWHKQLLTKMKVDSKIQGVENLLKNFHMPV